MKATLTAVKPKRDVDRSPLTPGEKVVIERLRKKLLARMKEDRRQNAQADRGS